MTCQPYILHLPALKVKWKSPAVISDAHTPSNVSLHQGITAAALSLSLFHFYWSKFSRTCFFNNAQNVFSGHWDLSKSSRVTSFEKWEHLCLVSNALMLLYATPVYLKSLHDELLHSAVANVSGGVFFWIEWKWIATGRYH